MGILLWVDDLRETPSPAWALARSVTEAIRYIDTMDIEEVSLDHDICHILPNRDGAPADILEKTSMLYQPLSCEETFEAVARFIAVKPGGIKRVHIHTSNPAGATRMAQIIAERQPHIKLSRRLGKIYEEADKDLKIDGQD